MTAWIIRRLRYKTKSYRKAGVYFIRARYPRRQGYPIDIQVWDGDGGEVGYRYRGLTARELRTVLRCENTTALSYWLRTLHRKAEGGK